MRYHYLSCFIICFLCIPASNALDTKTIRICSYNVENLFDLVVDGEEYPLYNPSKNRSWNNDALNVKLNNISDVISAIGPDLCVLCEIENEHALSLLTKKLKEKHLVLPHAVCGSDPLNRPVTVGLLSRFPITSSRELSIKGFRRSMIQADIMIGQTYLTVFCVHFPSKSHRESERIAYAQELMKAIKKLPQGRDYLIAGDFNSDYNECETTLNQGLDDAGGLTAINHILRTTLSEEYSNIQFVNKNVILNRKNEYLHFNPWLELPLQARASYVYHKNNATLDHILLPHTLFDANGISYKECSFAPVTLHGELLKDGEPYRWQVKNAFTSRPLHEKRGYSDHLPVTCLLTKGRFISEACNVLVSKPSGRSSDSPAGFMADFEETNAGFLNAGSDIFGRIETDREKKSTVLQIEGESTKNESVGSLTLSGKQLFLRKKQTHLRVSFDIKGTGRLAIAMRCDSSSWLYFFGEQFSSSAKSPKYELQNFPQWTRVSLEFPLSDKNITRFQWQIRAGKNHEHRVKIDNISIRGKP